MSIQHIKDQPLNESEITALREQFVSEYCARKGWDKNNLTMVQLLEIRSERGWKSPGLIKS